MRLNQRGLYKNVMRGPARVKVTGGELVEGADEKRFLKRWECLGGRRRKEFADWYEKMVHSAGFGVIDFLFLRWMN